jgi:hypothetical protein
MKREGREGLARPVWEEDMDSAQIGLENRKASLFPDLL